jgi:ABC-type transporter Mla subunit MlaD
MGVNFENFLQEQAEGGGLDEIKNNVNTTIVSAGQTFDALTQMLNVLTGILEDVRPSINDTVLNVNSASKSLAKVSVNLQKTVEKGYIDTTLLNLQETSGNLVLTTENFGGFSDSLNKKSTILTNCLLKNLNIVVCNMNEIIIGVGNTLKKRFGGLRLFFGKTIS